MGLAALTRLGLPSESSLTRILFTTFKREGESERARFLDIWSEDAAGGVREISFRLLKGMRLLSTTQSPALISS